MTMKFLVGVDGSEGSLRAAEFAVRETKAHGASLTILHVIDWSGFEHLDMASLAERHNEKEAELNQAKTQILEPLAEKLDCDGITCDFVATHGHIAEKICWYAENEGIEHVFAGKRGRGTLASLILGSVSSSLAQSCPVPITIIP